MQKTSQLFSLHNVRSYANFGLKRSLLQLKHTLRERKNALRNMTAVYDHLHQAEMRIEDKLNKPVNNLSILEIGPGQGLERARYFSIKNDVVGLDLDVIPCNGEPARFFRMLKVNGFGRLIKSFMRRILIGNLNEAAWRRVLEIDTFRNPKLVQGDICKQPPGLQCFDLVVSWSVFEHLSDPEQALRNIVDSLRQNGVFYISIHLFTSINGSHDIRAFTGYLDDLPYWGHLRPSTSHLVNPSAFLNKWRLSQWRELFSKLTPGFDEYLDESSLKEKYQAFLTNRLREELIDYTDEELFTVDAIYVWQKTF